MTTIDPIAAARARLRLAEDKFADLEKARQILDVELPRAQQAVEAARDSLLRIEAADQDRRQALRSAELAALKNQIEDARHV